MLISVRKPQTDPSPLWTIIAKVYVDGVEFKHCCEFDDTPDKGYAIQYDTSAVQPLTTFS